MEKVASQSFRERRARQRPSMRLKVEGKPNKPEVRVDHPDPALGSLPLANAIGTADFDFLDGLLARSTATTTRSGGSCATGREGGGEVACPLRKDKPKQSLRRNRWRKGWDNPSQPPHVSIFNDLACVRTTDFSNRL
jgi:hypothetical protein